MSDETKDLRAKSLAHAYLEIDRLRDENESLTNQLNNLRHESVEKSMKRHQFWVMLRLYAVLWPLLLLIYTIIGIINIYEFLKKRFS